MNRLSKLSKLVTSPDIFFKDMVEKRIGKYVAAKNKSIIYDKNIANGEKEIENKRKDEIRSLNKKNEIPKKVEVKSNAKIASIFLKNVNIYNPITTLIHCGESESVGFHQCKEWIEYLYEIRTSVVFLVRNLALYKKLILAFPERNIAYAKSPIDIENILNKLIYLKKIGFISNTANNIHLLRFNDYYHIYIGHYDDSRKPNIHKYFRVYDEVWLPNQKEVDDFCQEIDVRHIKVVNVGNPDESSIFKLVTSRVNKLLFPSVAYIPDWSINNIESISSVQHISKILDVILLKNLIFTVDVSMRVNEDLSIYKIRKDLVNFIKCNQRNLNINENEMSSIDWLKNCNYFIVDYVDDKNLNKFLLLNCPVIVFIPNNEVKNKFKNSSALNVCYHFSNSVELEAIFNDLLNGVDLLREDREEYIKYFLGVDTDSVFQENIKKLSSLSGEM